MKSIVIALCLLLLLAGMAQAQEAVMDEVRVEASPVSIFELTKDKAVDLFTLRLLERDETRHTLELQVANRSVLTNLLGLTSASPIPLGSSESRVDTFFLQNYLRADLNPSRANPLFDSKPRRNNR